MKANPLRTLPPTTRAPLPRRSRRRARRSGKLQSAFVVRAYLRSHRRREPEAQRRRANPARCRDGEGARSRHGPARKARRMPHGVPVTIEAFARHRGNNFHGRNERAGELRAAERRTHRRRTTTRPPARSSSAKPTRPISRWRSRRIILVCWPHPNNCRSTSIARRAGSGGAADRSSLRVDRRSTSAATRMAADHPRARTSAASPASSRPPGRVSRAGHIIDFSGTAANRSSHIGLLASLASARSSCVRAGAAFIAGPGQHRSVHRRRLRSTITGKST